MFPKRSLLHPRLFQFLFLPILFYQGKSVFSSNLLNCISITHQSYSVVFGSKEDWVTRREEVHTKEGVLCSTD